MLLILKLLGVLLAAGLLLGGVTVLLMSRMLLRPRRMTDVRALVRLNRMSPDDLGLPFIPMTFVVRDAQTNAPFRMSAWWIPRKPDAAPGRCVVLLHGYGDAKVGSIAWAPLFHDLGFNVLAIDLRAHGESEGTITTAGFFERRDMLQVIADLRTRHPEETRQIALFGVSLGAAVALATAELCQREGENIAAVICDSVFADYPSAVGAHGEILGFPGGILRHLGLTLAQRTTGASFDEVRPVDLIARVEAPLMLIIAEDDPFVPPAQSHALEHSAGTRSSERITDVLRLPECPHIFGLAFDPLTYRDAIEQFLRRALTPVEEKSPEITQTVTAAAGPHDRSAGA